MYRYVIFVFLIAIFWGCTNVDPNSPTNEDPIPSNVTAPYNIEIINNIDPFLSFDDEGNAMIFYGQDTLNTSEYGIKDGIIDLLMMKKYNKNGEVLIEEKNIIKTNAIIDYAVVNKNNLFYIIWLDPRNNPNFIANENIIEDHTYDVDIYYKIVNNLGETIKDDTRLTDSIIYYEDARDDYKLTVICNETLKALKESQRFTVDGDESFLLTKTWAIIDTNKNEYHIKQYGGHMVDSCKLSYTKLNPDSTIVTEEKLIAKFTKINGYYWGPEILNLFFKYNGSDSIHLCWMLNDGENKFIYYYAIINTVSDQIVLINVGEG